MNDSILTTSMSEVFAESNPNVTSLLTPEQVEEWEALLYNNRYTVQRILVPIVMIIGTLGNIVTIIVMTRRNMASSTTMYLTALAISDLLYLLFSFSLSINHLPGMGEKDNWVYLHYFKYALWLADASSSTSIWLTVTFTVERYIAVCHPMKGKSLSEPVDIFFGQYMVSLPFGRSRRQRTTQMNDETSGEIESVPSQVPVLQDTNQPTTKRPALCTVSRAKKIVISVFVLCFLLTASTPHEWVVMPDPARNETHIMLGYSSLGNNEVYIKVFYWFSALMFILLPITLLGIFNTFLILAVKDSGKQRSAMTGNTKRDNKASQENKITVMLIAVVLLSLTCQLPTAIMLIYSSVNKEPPISPGYYNIKILNNYFNLLTGINAAANFIFYCALSDRYRKTFMTIFCSNWEKRKPTRASWMSKTVYTNVEDGSPSSNKGSARPSRTSSVRSNISSNSKENPPQTAIKGSPFLTVPQGPTVGFVASKVEATATDSGEAQETSKLIPGKNIIITCQQPSVDEQTAV